MARVCKSGTRPGSGGVVSPAAGGGAAKAKELSLPGKSVSAEEACSLGIVNRWCLMRSWNLRYSSWPGR